MDELIADVPEEFHERFREIVSLTDQFCDRYLTNEFKELSREMAVEICDEGLPVTRGKPTSWASGIIYSLGRVNFVTDRTTQPHVSSAKMARAFAVSESTMMNKARTIRRRLDFDLMDRDWCVPSLLADNPLAWIIEINGFMIDARDLPRDAQETLYENGRIPFIYADSQHPPHDDATATLDAHQPRSANVVARIGPDGKAVPAHAAPQEDPASLPLFSGEPDRIRPRHSSRASLAGGIGTVMELKITLKRIKPPIWRRIAVDPETPLDMLHAIFQDVMGWEDDHPHAFTLDGGISFGDVDPDMNDERDARLCDLVAREGYRFTYEYDFGDGWEHVVQLMKIVPAKRGVRYPHCISGRRHCPPEDCGGPWGYANLIDALENPDDPAHCEAMEWTDGGFDPEQFDIDAVNSLLEDLRVT